MELTSIQERRITEYFRIGVVVKGILSAFEIIAGLLAFFVPVSSVTNYVIGLAQGELLEEPGDFIATHTILLAQQFSIASGTFIALYLLSRGLIKLALIFAMLKNQLWAYPSSLMVLGLFAVYQIYQITITGSVLLIALTIFDLVVMWFIWQEYEVILSHVRKYDH